MFVRQPIGDNFTWMHSGQADAPQIKGDRTSNGDMLKALDACLIDGFNEQTVESVLVEAGTVTLGFGFINHGYELRQRITVSGADDVALNGSHRVVALTPRTITINVLGVTQTTGVITTKVSPLSWESIFGSGDPLKRAYRSLNPDTTQTVLYLDMNIPLASDYDSTNPAHRAMVSMCADMQVLGTQIGSYTNAINNYSTNRNGSLFWYQARGSTRATNSISSNDSQWIIIGTTDYFYFFTAPSAADAFRKNIYRDVYAFGDMPSFGGDADSFNCFWQGAYNPNDAASFSNRSPIATNGSDVTGASSQQNLGYSGYFIRDYSGLIDMSYSSLTPSGGNTGYYTGYSGGVLFPNPINQALIAVPIYILSSGCLRAVAPRLLAIPQNMNGNDPSNFDLVIVDNIMTVAVYAPAGYTGYFAIDMGD